MKKRLLSWVLILSILTGMVPMQVFAAESGGKTPTGIKYINPFSDVQESDWFYSAVQYAKENSIFGGTSGSTFSPTDTMTRGMYVTVLGRIARIDTAIYTAAEFSDVALGSWYAPYVEWAAKAGITTGTGDGKFSPELPITREQMAALTLNFFEVQSIAYQSSTPRTDMPKDLDKISSWAKDAAVKMWRAGLLAGDDSGNLNPLALGTRAEAATFSMRTDKTVRVWRGEEVPGEKPVTTPGDGDGDGDGDVTSYTITFETNGGTALSQQKLASGAKPDKLPTPFKLNAFFENWYLEPELLTPVDTTKGITGNIKLYAKYVNADGVAEQQGQNFASLINQLPSLTILVSDTTRALTAEEIKEKIKYTCVTSPEFSADGLVVTSRGDNVFALSGKGGFIAGSTNKLELLSADLKFTDVAAVVTEYSFTIFKEETKSLELSQTLKYISADLVSEFTRNGQKAVGISVPLVKATQGETEVKPETLTGTFVFSGTDIAVGDTVAIYEGERPVDRGVETDYATDSEVAYVQISKKEGTKYTLIMSNKVTVSLPTVSEYTT